MRLLLDTCTFLWLISDDPKLSDKARKLFEKAENEVFLSSISLWEISVKYQLGKLPLPESPRHYIPKQREKHGIETLALGESDISHLLTLPNVHKDPFDRMLVCQAIEGNMTLLTPDPLIQDYPVKTDW
ncbi:MAG: type II toxin-antitoxin system VapC family toxin [Gammaproteobacteria bacterium]|nr:type II toxin-antitoxin system VapC family toxin [Gammaproteobacteria bacterium]